jgi:S1-C subfamily serine protease
LIITLQKSKLFIIAVAIVVLAGTFYIQSLVMAQTGSSSSFVAGAQPSSHYINTIFKRVERSIVQITSKVPISNPLNPQSPNATTALGSGFIYDKIEYCSSVQQELVCHITGHIITNNHVVGNAKIVDVTFVDGNRYTAKVIGTDIYSDIAVLQIIENITQQPSFTPLILGNSSKLEVGDPVLAIGNPFGLSDTIMTGIVSQTGRVIPADAAGGSFSISNIIQTDAPIAPGSSGGPLLNMQGQVVGMNTAGIPSIVASGIAFAIPADTITQIVPVLIENGTYVHPYIGLSGGTLTSDIIQNITGIPASSNLKGIYVDSIIKDGPADKAGIHGSTTDQYSKKHVGDIIVAIDGHPVINIDDMISYIDQRKAVDDKITLKVYRNAHTLDLTTTLTARPSPIPFLPVQSSPVPPTP